jgi:threonine/homoserine/homoserine lactone efflux protein
MISVEFLITSRLLAHAFRKLVVESARAQRWLRYSFAAAFAALGARLAVSER